MKNKAYTTEYQNERRSFEAVFVPENLEESERFETEDGFYAERAIYCGKVTGLNLRASETVVYAANSSEIYRYRNIDENQEFLTLVRHSNGKQYLMFRTDLYGYGVYDIAADNDFFYIPDEKETFIWTKLFYNPLNDMLAVSGCYWACPWDVTLLDFKNPMKETEWLNLHSKLDPGYEIYDDIDFVHWDGTSLIVTLDAIELVNGKEISVRREMRIEEPQYREWIDDDKMGRGNNVK